MFKLYFAENYYCHHLKFIHTAVVLCNEDGGSNILALGAGCKSHYSSGSS